MKDESNALVDAMTKMDLEVRAKRALSDAKAGMTMKGKWVFFAHIAMRMKAIPRWDEGCPTCSTNGKDLFYNPAFVCSLTRQELTGVLAHEVMHPAMDHIRRIGNRDMPRWNIAADATINPVLLNQGFKMPTGCVMPGADPWGFLGKEPLSAEEFYNKVPKQNKDKEEWGPDPGGTGGIAPPDPNAAPGQEQANHDAFSHILAEAAQLAKQQGHVPGGLEKIIEDFFAPVVDWRHVLREFVTKAVKQRSTFSPPSRRFIGQGVYLPRLTGEGLGKVIFAFDVSGSLWSDDAMKRIGGEINSILETLSPDGATIIYHDSKVTNVQEWEPGQTYQVEADGGGGTSHVPVFEWIEEHAPDPACTVLFTDLYTTFPKEEPTYPVLWGVLENDSPSVPFGTVVSCEK